MAAVTFVCSLCNETRTDLEAMESETFRRTLLRYHGSVGDDGAPICPRCTITPPSKSFTLGSLDVSTF